MWKWVGGIALGLVVLLVAGVCYGIRKVQSFAGDDGPTTTMVAASPDRVFASLASGDSLAAWMSVSGNVRVSRRGVLQAGDSVSVTPPNSAARSADWIVSEVTPGKLLVFQMRADSVGTVAATRRFTLEARGDSTAIISTVAAPMLDSLKTPNDSSTSGAMMNFATKMMMTAMRAQSRMELLQLKGRIEGTGAATAQP